MKIKQQNIREEPGGRVPRALGSMTIQEFLAFTDATGAHTTHTPSIPFNFLALLLMSTLATMNCRYKFENKVGSK